MLAAPMVAMPGGWELVLIVFVLILLFGAKKLPDLARGTGRALRIFKSETRGLMDEEDEKDDKDKADRAPREVTSGEGSDTRPEAPRQSADQPTESSTGQPPTHRPYGS